MIQHLVQADLEYGDRAEETRKLPRERGPNDNLYPMKESFYQVVLVSVLPELSRSTHGL